MGNAALTRGDEQGVVRKLNDEMQFRKLQSYVLLCKQWVWVVDISRSRGLWPNLFALGILVVDIARWDFYTKVAQPVFCEVTVFFLML